MRIRGANTNSQNGRCSEIQAVILPKIDCSTLVRLSPDCSMNGNKYVDWHKGGDNTPPATS